jgi:hypothetical protein
MGKADQERVRLLLHDTISLLCKNGLSYGTELKIEGLLGITIDKREVFIVHLNETLSDSNINISDSRRESSGTISNSDVTASRGSGDNFQKNNEAKRGSEKEFNAATNIKKESVVNNNDDVVLIETQSLFPQPNEISVQSSSIFGLETRYRAVSSGAERVFKRNSLTNCRSFTGFHQKAKRKRLLQHLETGTSFSHVQGSLLTGNKHCNGIRMTDGYNGSNRLSAVASEEARLNEEHRNIHNKTDMVTHDIHSSTFDATAVGIGLEHLNDSVAMPDLTGALSSPWLMRPNQCLQPSQLYGLMTRSRRTGDHCVKEYKCEYSGCDRAFYQKRNLVRHQRLKHRCDAMMTGDSEQQSYLLDDCSNL